MKWLSGLFFVIFLSSIGAVPVPFAVEPARLPKTSFPVKYIVLIRATEIHEGNRDFSGAVRIELQVAEPTIRITLHNRGLTILTVDLLDDDDSYITNTATHEPENEFLHVESSNQLLPGRLYKVVITYSSQLNSQPTGFYRSTYRDAGNAIR